MESLACCQGIFMGSDLHPADELSLVREQMRHLQEREAELSAGFLSGDLPRVGKIAQVSLQVQRRRVLRPETLPPSIETDPRYWRQSESHVLVVEDKSYDWADSEDDEAIVIEPFDA